MKQFILLFFVLSALNLTSLSQRIYFCNNYTTNGDPIESGYTWTISGTGGNVYILFQNGGRVINSGNISFYLDYLSGSEYKAWDTKVLSVPAGRTWFALDYKFTATGSYRVTALINGYEVAKEYVTIKSNTSTTASGSSNTSSSSTLYYSGSAVMPGTDIDLNSGYVYGLNGPFYLNSQYTAKVFFKVTNGSKKLGTTKLIVDIYKMNANSNYDYYATKNFDISDLDWVYFYYDFYSAGSYKVSVSNGSGVWINTAYLAIK